MKNIIHILMPLAVTLILSACEEVAPSPSPLGQWKVYEASSISVDSDGETTKKDLDVEHAYIDFTPAYMLKYDETNGSPTVEQTKYVTERQYIIPEICIPESQISFEILENGDLKLVEKTMDYELVTLCKKTDNIPYDYNQIIKNVLKDNLNYKVLSQMIMMTEKRGRALYVRDVRFNVLEDIIVFVSNSGRGRVLDYDMGDELLDFSWKQEHFSITIKTGPEESKLTIVSISPDSMIIQQQEEPRFLDSGHSRPIRVRSFFLENIHE